jgi:hypothetical protein
MHPGTCAVDVAPVGVTDYVVTELDGVTPVIAEAVFGEKPAQ